MFFNLPGQSTLVVDLARRSSARQDGIRMPKSKIESWPGRPSILVSLKDFIQYKINTNMLIQNLRSF